MRDKKFLRRIIEILFILLLIVPSQPIYARAGGGGGGGGGGAGGGYASSSESGGGKDGASAFDFKFIMKHKLLFGSVAFIAVWRGSFNVCGDG